MNNQKININKIEEQVCLIIAEKLCLDVCEIPHTAHLRDELCADSLDIVEIIMALAETFNINICADDFQTINTINDIVAYITAMFSPTSIKAMDSISQTHTSSEMMPRN